MSPSNFASIDTAVVTSGWTPIEVMRSVGGTETFTGFESASNPEKSLNMLSFPEIYGVPKLTAPS